MSRVETTPNGNPTPDYAAIYSDSPVLHRNATLASLQLFLWLFLHPLAWRNYIARIAPDLSANFTPFHIQSKHWHNPQIRRLMFVGYVVPFLWATLFSIASLMIHPAKPNSGVVTAGGIFTTLLTCLVSVASGMLMLSILCLYKLLYMACTIAPALYLFIVKLKYEFIVSTAIGIALRTAVRLEQFPIQSDITISWRNQVAETAKCFLWSIVLVAISGGFIVILGFAVFSRLPYDNSYTDLVGTVLVSVCTSMIVLFSVGRQMGLHKGFVAGAITFVMLWSVLFCSNFLFKSSQSWATRTEASSSLFSFLVDASNYIGSLVAQICFACTMLLPILLSRRLGGIRVIAGVLFLFVPLVLSVQAVSIVSNPYKNGSFGFENYKFVIIGVSVSWWVPVLSYPFLFLWNRVQLMLEERSSTTRRLSRLRHNSAFWDEIQRLRLFGLDKHLLLVLERNPEEGNAALNYLSTRNQRWAAQSAQIEMDARALEQCVSVQIIANGARTFFMSELEGPVSALLRSFGRVQQDVQAAMRQGSAYNQRLALSVVEDRLDELTRELTRSSERYAVRFRPIAVQWRKTVADFTRQLAETVEQRQEIDDPYVIGVPLTGQQDIFTGRTDVCARIEQLLLDRRRPPLFLYGQRRMGKTSLLNNLGRLLPSSIVPFFVDLQGPASLAGDYAGFLYNIARGMSDSVRQQRGISLPPLEREQLAADPFTRFDEWLDEVEKTIGRSTGLLCLDEFEALDNALEQGRFGEQQVLGMFRHLIQHRPRFKVLLSGSHTLEELERWASYLINVQVVRVGYLQPDEARHLVEHPTPDFTLRYEPQARERILDVTRGHPYLIQLLCSEIVALKNEQEPVLRRLATLDDVEDAVPEALQSGSLFFADIQRNQITPDGLKLLRRLAACGENGVMQEAECRDFIGEQADSSLSLLLQRDVIERCEDGYHFQVELIRRWFAR